MSIFNKLKKGVSDAGSKAKNSVEASKLKGQITKNMEEINSHYLEIGKAVFASYQQPSPTIVVSDTVDKHISQVNELLKNNQEIENKIKALWNQKECVCGKTSTLDAVFCSACGYQFPSSPVEETTEKTKVTSEVVQNVESVQPAETSIHEAAETIEADTIPIDEGSNKEPIENANNTEVCRNCNTALEKDARFCGECGAGVEIGENEGTQS